MHVLIDTPKGQRNVNFPLDDYFMALAVLATVRSPFPKEVCIVLHFHMPLLTIVYAYV